ncbi:S8 family serine peptidase [Pontibacter akesuensis]|uniref:Por secretion system C-terminal sorting domain-containing protein n=1 Tax=Pontibacter akesuensis TaxID=388950 RepID=A0A1I7KSH0_9BACT|nr:S8 family serine peptidase [Pontibacter akesuensis]GHA81003.1 hypothetical protein GCM10007389_39440 [Pontibacter akesuensis]SFV00294.1 Por secretion system C-terminal sorting domain-containing protein [Pontibacter akesuensis]
MKKNYFVKGVLGLMLAGQVFSANAQELSSAQLVPANTPHQSPDEKPYHDDKIFVKFRQLETGTAIEFNGKSERAKKLKDDKISKALLKADARLMRQAAGKGSGNGVARIFQVELDGSVSSVKQLISELKAMPEVEYAELVPIYQIHAAPSDPSYTGGSQYSLNITKAVQSYSSFNATGAPIKVAIVDDAVLTSHTDLKANIWSNPGETGVDASGKDKASNGIDDDNNGYIDDVNGWDSADNDNNPNPPLVATALGNIAGPNTFSHGTHCAGIAGAVTNNGVGIASISNNKVQIVAVKCTPDNAANTRSIYTSFAGLAYAIRGAKADVVSMSFGGSGYSQAFQDLINEGAAQGMIFIASAGNNNNNLEQFPATYQHVISVSNTDEVDKKSSSSTFGNWVTIAAPGTNIYSTVAGTGTGIAAGGYTNYTGTSMSGPMVAGLAGYIKAQKPSLTPTQVRDIIVSTSDNVDILNPGYEGLLGAGRINVYQAIVAAGGTVLAPTVDFIPSKVSAVIGEEVAFANRSTGSNLTYAWTFQNANIATSTAKNPVVKFLAAGTHEVTLSINGGASKSVKINVSGFTALDVLGLPLAGPVGASGVNGHSANNIPAFANFYKYSTTHMISGVNISFRLATAGSANSTVRVKVWEAERGIPGRVLHTQTVKISDLKPNGLAGTLSPNYIYFDKPVQVPANSSFYVGFEIDYGTGDNISIHHTTYTGSGSESALFFNNSWQINAQVGARWTFAIFPVLANASEYPAGPISVTPAEACVGGQVTFDGASVNKATAYRWTFGNGTTAATATATSVYTTGGTYLPTLVATRAVNITEGTAVYPVELRQSFTKQIRVADCAQEPVAGFEVSALSANVGSAITFTNTTANATSYEWLISQGSTKIRSTEESPVVTFKTKGKYDVTLVTRNPEGDVSTSTKKQYIEIFTAGQDCGNVDFPFPARLTTFGTGAGGTFSGHNGYGIGTYAKSFDLAAGTVVSKAMFNIATAAAKVPATSFITVNVWNAGLNGTPGEVISSVKVSYTKMMQAIATNGGNMEVILDQPVVLSVDSRIYVGFAVNFIAGDNMAVASKLAGPNMGERSLALYGSTWYTLKDLVSLSTDFAIGIGTFDNIDKLPIANFTTSATTVAVGESIKLDASQSKKAQVYNWQVSGGTVTAMGESAASAVYDPTKAAVVFSKAGKYTITLVVMGDCGAKVAMKTIEVEVTGTTPVATETSVEESKAAGITDLITDASLVYPNPSTGQYNVVLKGVAQQQVVVSVWDLTGKEVSRKNVTLNSNSEVHQVNLGNQPVGMYLLHVTAGNKVQVHKLIKK